MYDLAAADGNAARCANSGRVVVNIGCDTLARTLGYGYYQQQERPRFSEDGVAQRVAGLKTLIIEEASAISNHLMTRHMRVIEDAQMLVNESLRSNGQAP